MIRYLVHQFNVLLIGPTIHNIVQAAVVVNTSDDFDVNGKVASCSFGAGGMNMDKAAQHYLQLRLPGTILK